MTTVFLDTVGLIALWNRSDQWHAVATAAFHALDPKNTHLVTTTYVLLECANAAARRPYRDKVIAIRDDMGQAGDLYEPTLQERRTGVDGLCPQASRVGRRHRSRFLRRHAPPGPFGSVHQRRSLSGGRIHHSVLIPRVDQ